MLFINEDIREQMKQDTLHVFHAKNPDSKINAPLTGLHWMLYAMRWVKYYALPGFIH